jgi:choline dehydrogenase-like flavoprotein
MNLVVGSGPAGSACAHGLLARGEEVLLVDGGLELDPPQKALLENLTTGFQEAPYAELARFQARTPVTSKGIPVKLVHGSDFPYREVQEQLGLDLVGAGPSSSLAVGGLSNVWGAAIMPYLQRDIMDWPISAKELAGHYEAAVAITGLSARVDDLAETFPLYTAGPHFLQSSSQGRAILEKLVSLRPQLSRERISFGAARLAIRPSKSTGLGCIYCGRCLHGCPYGCIYSSSDDLPGLIAQSSGRFHHRPNTVIQSVRESSSGIVATGYDRILKETVTIEADRAFVGAGVLPSTKILLKSMDAYDETVEIQDSQYFLFPVLSLAGTKNVSREALYTLSQIFLEIQDDEISKYTVHLQLYTYNDIMVATLHQKFRFLPFLKQLLVGHLQNRLMVVQGFIHSADSGRIKVQLKRDPGSSGGDRLLVEGVPNPQAKEVVHRVIKKLGRCLHGVGLFPIRQAVEIAPPGRGNHYGGSFPMSARPAGYDSDIAGRVRGFARTHVVDASVFPSIAATTVTLTSMANAHRIATMARYE